ncbi:hypothetical protein CPAV1605_643 [seawater metagenome]|uniref:S1 motif domain-containing protein n=1 Tax=seawater metagenome TaxID=1561972 RepID=A0A5E8CHN9_9ZZZZ
MKDPLQFYNNTKPVLDEIVMIRYDDIAENCVYVTLLEYNIKGIIIFKELSKRRLRKRNLRQAAPIGKFAPAIVCDEAEDEDSNISLTRKRLTDDEVKQFTEKYRKNRKIISIMENLGYFAQKKIQEMFTMIAHPLDKQYIEDEEYDTLYDFLEEKFDDFSYLDFLNLDNEILEKFKELIIKNFSKASEKIQTKMAIVSNTIEGINLTKQILTKYENENPDFLFYLEKAPYYIIEKTSDDVNNDQKRMDSIATSIGEFISSKQGNFKVIN